MAMSDSEYLEPRRPPMEETASEESPADWGIPAGTGIYLPRHQVGTTADRDDDDTADDEVTAPDAGYEDAGYEGGDDVYEDVGAGGDSGWTPPFSGSSGGGGPSRRGNWAGGPGPGQVLRPASAMKIGIWGAPGSGKTTYLAALNSSCANADVRIGRWSMFPCDAPSRQMMDDLVQRLIVDRTFPEPNNPGQYHEFRWNLTGNIENSRYAERKLFRRRAPEQREFDIELIDASGEVFGPDQQVPEAVRKTALDHLEASDGLLFLFDPITEKSKPSVAQYAHNVLSGLLLRAQETGRKVGRFLPYRVAVCITKTDDPELLLQARKAGLVFADNGVERIPDSMAEELFNAICEGRFWDSGESDQLSTTGAEYVRDQLKVHFGEEQIRYYAVSAVGHQTINVQDKQQRLHNPIKPFNVLEPLVELHMQLAGRA